MSEHGPSSSDFGCFVFLLTAVFIILFSYLGDIKVQLSTIVTTLQQTAKETK